MTETPDEREARRCSWRTAHGPHGWVLESVNYWCVGCTAATYTAAEVKVLTEAALRLGRKEAGEEIAVRLEAIRDQIGDGEQRELAHDMAAIARYIALQAAPDASSARTDLSVDTDLPQDSRAVRSPQEDA